MKEIFDWVPWFQDLASKINEGGRDTLAKNARKMDWGQRDPALLKFGNENIDPFSFIYYLAALNSVNNWKTVYSEVANVYGIRRRVDYESAEAFYYPTPRAYNVLFHNRGKADTDLLWELLAQALSYSVRSDTFKAVLKIPGVGVAKLSQTLFLIDPTKFLPFDNHGVLALRMVLGTGNYEEPRAEIEWDEYRKEMKRIMEAFPGCECYEVNMFSYLWKHGSMPVDLHSCYQVSTNVYNDGMDYWEDFEENNWVYTGGPGNRRGWPKKGGTTQRKKRDYPLDSPECGDVVLVRYRRRYGRGIGIVYTNDYQKELSSKSRLHVLWLNKKSANLAGTTPIIGFSKAREATRTVFRSTEGYSPTFGLLDRLTSDPPPPPPPPNPVVHPCNQILYGPPGTGKTYNAVNRAMAIVLGVDRIGEEDRAKFRAFQFDPAEGTGQIAMVTFHQSFSYEEFVEGIRPRLDAGNELGYERRDGIFKRIANVADEERRARHDSAQKYVLIIDEINRGNIPKIFGELITLIEESRRLGGSDATRVVLPYSNKEFGVPNNLYIIGTMNTADRSIVLVDTALRRRFDFVEMMPKPEHKHISDDFDGVQLRKMLKAMNERISLLLDRERQIGHTYLFNVTDMETLSHKFRNAILPLLQEYFYDDWSKIREVLGGAGFVVKQKQTYTARLRNSDLVDEDRIVYERLPDGHDKWLDPDEYGKIYSDDTSSESS